MVVSRNFGGAGAGARRTSLAACRPKCHNVRTFGKELHELGAVRWQARPDKVVRDRRLSFWSFLFVSALFSSR